MKKIFKFAIISTILGSSMPIFAPEEMETETGVKTPKKVEEMSPEEKIAEKRKFLNEPEGGKGGELELYTPPSMTKVEPAPIGEHQPLTLTRPIGESELAPSPIERNIPLEWESELLPEEEKTSIGKGQTVMGQREEGRTPVVAKKSIIQRINDLIEKFISLFKRTKTVMTSIKMENNITNSISYDQEKMKLFDIGFDDLRGFPPEKGSEVILSSKQIVPSETDIRELLLKENPQIQQIQNPEALDPNEIRDYTQAAINMKYAQYKWDFLKTIGFEHPETNLNPNQQDVNGWVDVMDATSRSDFNTKVTTFLLKKDTLMSTFNDLSARYDKDLNSFNTLKEPPAATKFMELRQTGAVELSGMKDFISALREKINSIPEPSDFNRNDVNEIANFLNKTFEDVYTAEQSLDGLHWYLESLERLTRDFNSTTGQPPVVPPHKISGQQATSSVSVAPIPEVELTKVPPPYETLQQVPPG